VTRQCAGTPEAFGLRAAPERIARHGTVSRVQQLAAASYVPLPGPIHYPLRLQSFGEKMTDFSSLLSGS
jgi:hypothetical protein